MNSQILIALANKWKREANAPQTEDGSESAAIGNAVRNGHRQQKRECAEQLMKLVELLGDDGSDVF